MRVETKLFYWLLAFFVIVAAVYTYFTGFTEPVGAVGLLLTAIMCAMIAWYLGKTGRKLDLRPDDNEDGEIADQAGPYGHFSPHSWWPLWLGLSGAAVFLGVAIGWWMVLIAAPFLAISTVGWVFEYFRGEHAV
ncbi:cytochrome c oxidase subunit 4 [Ornithinimicrobium cavernae]|uniref:cytochrome c oxidase subunit 4 n=1 Tax=Ornithinimicrobium cavernae TaxID=2666047 RepID=UPI000D692E15|nr:cytochrome c oxidase subunit 4 [Ornithinimicrobium cavernae]